MLRLRTIGIATVVSCALLAGGFYFWWPKSTLESADEIDLAMPTEDHLHRNWMGEVGVTDVPVTDPSYNFP